MAAKDAAQQAFIGHMNGWIEAEKKGQWDKQPKIIALMSSCDPVRGQSKEEKLRYFQLKAHGKLRELAYKNLTRSRLLGP
ncbi:hypothetical protein [Palleronia caenipelagi]|uniref:Uncharacterized protein n=1 Tax=Palleronia caenipelagi TaxID=2489174 RepID=A0A547PKZ2_9RHOB|nr:hypothetical protein [Palleronia caenipelagi]TRD14805.1 hypothetical protein FEV53_18315 [Palleronia caenipelagi]